MKGTVAMPGLRKSLQTSPRLIPYKIQASLLLKQLLSERQEQAKQAAARFLQLPVFTGQSLRDLFTHKAVIKRKHALHVIALENGYANWAALKQVHEMSSSNPKPLNPATMLYPSRCTGFLNHWYAQYPEAKHAHATLGGYLLTYKTQYFICGRDYIEALGLNPDDPAWEQIAWDWAQPANLQARDALVQKLAAVS